MFETKSFSSIDPDVRTIETSRECLSFALERMFDPRVICANQGEACERIEDTIHLLSRNLEREELLMAEVLYPELAAHKREHERVLEIMNRLKRTLVCGRYDNTLVFNFLTGWTKSHAANFDKHFANFLRERGFESV